MLILTTSMLLSSTNTITAKTPDDTKPVTEKDKHHGDEGYPEPIQVTMDTTTGLLNVSFNTSLNDVTIALYKNGAFVCTEEEGDVFIDDCTWFNLSNYGKGSYLIVVSSENDIIFTDTICY